MKTFSKRIHDFFAVDESTKGFGIEFFLTALALFFLGLFLILSFEPEELGADVVPEEEQVVENNISELE